MSGRTKIFICYRREDSQDVAGRIFDHLSARYGKAQIFKDVDSILPGVNFRDYALETILSCAILVVVIGPRWLERTGEGAPRIHRKDDFVRLEIETAHQAGVSILPVLVGNAAPLLKHSLPPTLGFLAEIQCCVVRSDPDFRADLRRLCDALQQQRGSPLWPRDSWSAVVRYSLSGAVAVAVAMIWVATRMGHVSVAASPVSANVSIDGVPVAGTTPAAFELRPGRHRIAVSTAGYDATQREVVVWPGLTTTVSLTMSTSTTGFDVTSEPPGAFVWLDGSVVSDAGGNARTPRRLLGVAPGQHLIEVVSEDTTYRRWQHEFTAEAGIVKPVSATLVLVGELSKEDKAETKRAYQEATRAYDIGDYQAAVEGYSKAYSISGDPPMLYNVAQAYRLSKRPIDAIRFYRRYLQRAPQASNREDVERKIAELEKATKIAEAP